MNGIYDVGDINITKRIKVWADNRKATIRGSKAVPVCGSSGNNRWSFVVGENETFKAETMTRT